jgi:HD-GYP domain-containing protein (c-di-GMP phosphodiesterase class II)
MEDGVVKMKLSTNGLHPDCNDQEESSAVVSEDETEAGIAESSTDLRSRGISYRDSTEDVHNSKPLSFGILDLALIKQQRDLRLVHLDSLNQLARAAELRDDNTGAHVARVGRLSEIVAEKLGLSSEMVQDIGYAAPLHDLGKIGIPDTILLKPGRLTPEEFEIMKTHTIEGAEILSGTEAPVIEVAREIALYHHERWDGNGYPDGLSGEDIPLAARIVSVVDTFEAVTSRRPYSEERTVEEACKILIENKGKQFDPTIVDVFVTNLDEILGARKDINQPSGTLYRGTGHTGESRNSKNDL